MKVIELRKMQGELLPVEDVRSSWNEALGIVCQALNDLPQAIAQRAGSQLQLDKQARDALRAVVDQQVAETKARIREQAKR